MDTDSHDPWGEQDNVRTIEIKKQDPEFIKKHIREIWNCTVEDVRKTAPLLEQALKNGEFCVIGSEASIMKNADMFGYIRNLTEDEDTDEEEKGG